MAARKITPTLAHRILLSQAQNGDLVPMNVVRAAILAIATGKAVTVR